MISPLPARMDPILIVEDDPGTALLVSNRLKEAGLAAEIVCSGSEALAWLAKGRASLMLLDNSLPDFTGEELVRMGGAQAGFPPFIVTTGSGSERLAVSLMKQGARDYLVKDEAFLRSLLPVIGRVLKELETEQRLAAAEAALRESERQFRCFTEHASLAVFILNEEGRFLEANPAASAITGFSTQELTQLTIFEVLPPDEVPAFERQFMQLGMQGRISGEFPFHAKSGRPGVWALESVQISPARFMALAMDLTRRRELEREARTLQEQLQHAQKMESLGVLAGGVAHDMNNVLGAILGAASALNRRTGRGGPAWDAIDTIIKAAERGGAMVQGLLAFARKEPARVRTLDLNTLVLDEAHLLQHSTFARVQVDLDLAQDLHPIQGDAGALTHCLMNLCVNAVDAMADGGRLTLRTENDGPGWIRLHVEDTGPGMTKEVLERAMDPFFTTKPEGKGTGLGLSMVFTTVKAHGGRLEIHSQPGQGTRVEVLLPVSAAPPAAAETLPEAEARPAGKGIRVLLVDDDELVQRSTRMVAEALGHSVDAFGCGEDAIAWLKQGGAPDVVILDMNMPGLGGKGTLPCIRAERPAVPILLATGRADQAALDLVASQPGVRLLPKPYGIDDLQARLGEIRPGRQS